MKKIFENKAVPKSIDYFILLLITILGFVLRCYKVGESSFWYDEVGQVVAATQPRLMDVLLIVRQHAGAMPLDYMVSRLMASISLTESVMRFPSVLWGTLSIPVYYLLFNEIKVPHNRQISLLAAFMLSLSPINIQYAQEVRFYASLMFFYVLSAWLLLRAIHDNSLSNWLFYLLICVIGIYFHPYVIFSTLIGFLFIIEDLPREESLLAYVKRHRKLFQRYILSEVGIIVLLGLGYIFFNAQDTFNYDLGLTLNSLLSGLGLLAAITTKALPFLGLWHFFQIVGVSVGVVSISKDFNRYKSVVFLWILILLQIIAIVSLDVLNHYPFIPRQIIHYTPFVSLVFSIGVVEIVHILKRSWFQNIALVIAVVGLGVSAVPYIGAVYTHSKGSARDIASMIVKGYQPGQTILVLSAEQETILRYYLSRLVGEEKSTDMTIATEDSDDLMRIIQEEPNVEFVFLAKDVDAEIRQNVKEFGFKQVAFPNGGDFLFVLK